MWWSSLCIYQLPKYYQPPPTFVKSKWHYFYNEMVTTKLDPENRNESKSKTLDHSTQKKVRFIPWNAGRPGELEKREPFFTTRKKSGKIPGLFRFRLSPIF